MAEQEQPRRRTWEERARELAGEATNQIVRRFEEELRAKQEQLDQVNSELQEASVIQKLEEKAQLEGEIRELNRELEFARDSVAPAMVEGAQTAGRNRDRPPRGGCFS